VTFIIYVIMHEEMAHIPVAICLHHIIYDSVVFRVHKEIDRILIKISPSHQ